MSTIDRKAVIVFAQAVAALIELEAMKAENEYDKSRGREPSFGPTEFMALKKRYGLNRTDIEDYFLK